MMKRRGILHAWVLATGLALCAGSAFAKSKAVEAVSGIVSGDVQKVGFRALIFKEAIRYNLAGSAKNNDNGTVLFSLQGEKKRIDHALSAIRGGTKKSSNVSVGTSPVAVDPNLTGFTIIAWTSTSRNITNPYDLTFTLRADDSTLSRKEAKAVWHEILRATLKGDDLNKLGDDDD